MKLEVVDFIENEDGSGTIITDLDREAIQLLIEKGMNKLILDVINEIKD